MGQRLGQNFLKDKNFVNKIISESDLARDNVVMEIGPGKGVLTEELAECAGRILAIEIDPDLVGFLECKFKSDKKVEIISGDILSINLNELSLRYRLAETGYKVVANIPYYITSKIIRLFLEAENPPKEMILMVQKEVAERIVAQPGQMSILAVSVRYYADAEILFDVPKEAFDPIPEVDSAVVKIKYRTPVSLKSKQDIKDKQEAKNFFRIVKAGFSARRKTLVNNLSASLQLEKKEVEYVLQSLGFLPTVRAQELAVLDWKKLARELRKIDKYNNQAV